MRSSLRVLSTLALAACAGAGAGLDLASDAPADDDALNDGAPSAIQDPSAMSGPSDWYEEDRAASPFEAFEEAESRFDVPAELLLALSTEATGHAMVSGDIEFEGQIPVHGIMAIPDDMLDEAAALAQEPVEDVLEVRRANIFAAAALLSRWAHEDAVRRDDLADWAPLIARFSGIEDENGQAAFVHDQVYAALQDGIDLEGVSLPPIEVDPDFPLPYEPTSATGADRSYAVWRSSPNNSARPSGSGGKPSMVIIHTCEGSYSGCYSWLRNPRARASAHYVVNSTGSEVTQLVRESRKAWHISATYQCSRNKSTDCWRNGSSSNNFTIGIEHAGYASQKSWHSGLIDTSARLTCDITKTHGIPRDAYHIVGHGQLQPYNRTDPGKNWPWSSYLAKVKSKCGSSGGSSSTGGTTKAPAGTRVIDSNNARNDTKNQKIAVSGNWKSSANVSGYYGTGYWWRSVGSSSDSARFQFRNDKTTCYAVQAWWPAARDRSAKAPWIIQDPSGKVMDKVIVDQRSKHARWVQLGTYNFAKGWNTVALSRWTSSGKVVVADAVRLVPSTGCASTPPKKEAINIVVDSANGRNDTSKAKVSYSRSWTSARATSGYYGTDYVWAGTDAVSDGFGFSFKLPEKRRVRIQARWTSGSNRSKVAPFMLWSPSGTLLDKVTVDQTRNHATWVTLGTWTLPAGWNKLDLSRWAPTGKVVVADAIRVQSVD